MSPCLILVALFLCCSRAPAQGTWNLTTADFHSEAIQLRSIGEDGLHISGATGADEHVIAYDHFLELTRGGAAALPAGKFTLHLLGGDRLGGMPTGIKGNDLLWNSPAVGDLSIPMKQLLAITQPGKQPPAAQKQDVVTLGNGDVLKGIIATLGDNKISVQTDAGPSEAPLGAIASISFAVTASSAKAEKGFRIRFDDGESIIASAVSLKDEKLNLSIGKANRDIPLTRVSAIEQVNGPVSWLSTRTPVESVYIPYFGNDSLYAAKMDANYKGEEIRFHDTHFARGIGVHAYSRLAWDLDGTYAAFRTRYAIDGDGPLADVTVRIKLDDKVAYEKEHVRAGVLSPVVLLDLGSAKRLTLEVDFGANGMTQDRFNWIEPALMKEKPAPETETGKGDGAPATTAPATQEAKP